MDPFTSEFSVALGRSLFIRRKIQGLSTAAVSDEIGTTRKTLSAIEAGSRKPDLRLGLNAYLRLGGPVMNLSDAILASLNGLDVDEVLRREGVFEDRLRAAELEQQLLLPTKKTA